MKVGMDVPKMSYLKPPDHLSSPSTSTQHPSPRGHQHHQHQHGSPRKPSINVMRLQDILNSQFNKRDSTDFIDALNEYHAQRDIGEFSQVLRRLLDTPAKKQMILILRKVIPKSDVPMFDQCTRGIMHTHESHSLPRTAGLANLGHRAIHLPHQFQTLPSRPKHAVHRPKSAPTSPNVIRQFPKPFPAPSSPVKSSQPVKHILLKNQTSRHGWGFSIRGGSEHGIGIYVSYVDINSVAERQGLMPGDQIVSVNDISFSKITHGDAAKIIKASKRLDLQVRSVGRVPGSFETRQKFTWVDPHGRSVSPPLDVDTDGQSETTESRKSGFMLLNGSDERKVNMLVGDGQSLGLSIRGGNEFGLGIYITGVAKNSVAENAGLKKGDQILDVNGQSFSDLSHAEGVQILKHSKHLMMTVRDVGRMPHAKMTYDQTQWIDSRPASPASSTRNSPLLERNSNRDVFLRGAGSQLMLNSMANQHWVLIDEQARHLLNTNERKTLNYYLREFQRDHISTDGLVLALLELFNTNAKMSLMKEVRNLIGPRDIDRFDMLVLKREVDAMKVNDSPAVLPSDRLSENSYDSASSTSRYSSGSYRGSFDGSGSDNCVPHLLHHKIHPHLHNNQKVGKVSNDPLWVAIEQITDESDTESLYLANNTRTQKVKGKSSQKPSIMAQNSPSPQPANLPQNKTVIVQIHSTPVSTQVNEELKPPSDDSGVEMNSLQMDHLNHARTFVTMNPSKRVTMSNEHPVIINEIVPEQSPVPPSEERENYSPHQEENSPVSHPPSPQLQQQRRHSVDSSTSENSSQSMESITERLGTSGHYGRMSEILNLNTQQASVKPPVNNYVTKHVVIRKTKPTLGIAIEGGAKTRQPLPRIINIQPGGAAYDADLEVGQVIMEVNGRSLEGLQHNEAARAIAEAFKTKRSPIMEMNVMVFIE